MITVLIVDDEYLIRSLVKSLIPWERLGLTFAGEAADGEQAYQIIQEKHPDIVILDINLPIMNGLELTKKLYENGFDTHVIFLTGYRNFEYARLAVTYRAYDFLLKPISKEELSFALERLATSIRAEQVKAVPLNPEEPALQEAFLRRLCFGRVGASPDLTAAELMRHALPLRPENLLVMSAELRFHDESSDGVYTYALFNILQELILKDDHFKNVCGFPSEDERTILLANILAPEKVQEILHKIGAQANRILKSNFPFTAVIGVSEVFSGYDRIHGAVRTAIHCADRTICHSEEIVFFPSGGETGASFEAWLVAACGTLKSILTAGSWQKGRAYLQSVFRTMHRQHLNQSVFRTASIRISAVLYEEAERRGILNTAEIERGALPTGRIVGHPTGRELEIILLDFYDTLESHSEQSSLSVLTRNVKRYVLAHYRECDLGLLQIADNVHASQAYVSSLFKRETGTSITEFITACRLRTAADLLSADTGIGLAEVAQKAGWSDPYYFSKIFKKHFGVAPSKFAADSDWYLEPDESEPQTAEPDDTE